MELVRERGVKVTYACRLFGHCRQAFYQLKAGLSVELGRERLIMENARHPWGVPRHWRLQALGDAPLVARPLVRPRA